jgi:hypothetical protein
VATSQLFFLSASEEENMTKERVLNAEKNVERIRESLGSWSILPTDEPLFLQQDDYWAIRYHGHVALLKSTRGLRYLGVLLGAPGHEFHVRELLAHPIGPTAPAAAVAAHQPVTGRLCVGVPLLDAQAKAQCKWRLRELRRDLDESERFNDIHRQSHVQEELHAITDYLASAVGLGGRDRKASSDAERARSAVTKCIKKAIRQIGYAIPPLGYHLGARIKTGYFCSYNPHPERPVTWKL